MLNACKHMTWEEMMVPLFFGTLHHYLVSLPDKGCTAPRGLPSHRPWLKRQAPKLWYTERLSYSPKVTWQDQEAGFLGQLQSFVGTREAENLVSLCVGS